MAPARGRNLVILLALSLAGCSSYRMVVQGVDVDRLIESRTAGTGSAGERREAAFHNDLGVLLEREGDLEGALEQYRIARAKDPGLVLAYINAGNVRVKLGDLEGAEQLYRQALEREPENPQTLNNLAWGLILEGRRLDEATALLERALASDPDRPYLYLDSLGWALYRRGEIEPARATLLTALERIPEEESYLLSETHYHLGVILQEAGEAEAAAGHFEKSLRYHPDPDRKRELEKILNPKQLTD